MSVRMDVVTYAGWKNCIRLTAGKVELVITTAVGPRVIRCGLRGGPNLFKEYAEQRGQSGGASWRIYGGHRLWHAPEVSPRTYAPDNGPVAWDWKGGTLTLDQPVEPSTGIEKQIRITPAASGLIELRHRLVNRNPWEIELAPWCLTVMAPGGRAIFPQEKFIPHTEHLLPARPLVLWHYTDMADPRWTWGAKFIQLRQDPKRPAPQKVGLFIRDGWAAYTLRGQVFIKRFPARIGAPHADFGCNAETFTNGEMLEVESVGALARLAAGGQVEQVERWGVFAARVGATERAIETGIPALVRRIPAVT
jgi:hypothetical protein